jgi:hypothetical protein
LSSVRSHFWDQWEKFGNQGRRFRLNSQILCDPDVAVLEKLDAHAHHSQNPSSSAFVAFYETRNGRGNHIAQFHASLGVHHLIQKNGESP